MAHSADIVQLAPEELLLMQQRYEEMVRRHTGLIRRVCVLRSGGDEELCRELEQEVAIGLWLHLDSYIPGRAEAVWVYWRARKVVYDYFHRRLPPPDRLSRDIADTMAEEINQGCEQLEEIMAYLSPEERRLLELRLEEESVADMADRLQCSPSAVYKRLEQVIKKARKINEKLNRR